MISESIDRKRNSPKILVENKISFSGPKSELSIYDTYEPATRVKLQSDQLLYCAMVTGKKVMHAQSDTIHQPFMPHESFIMAPNQPVEIDFPLAKLSNPTTCLAIEISPEKISEVADKLNVNSPRISAFDEWHYNEGLVHSHHNSETQALLNRMVHIYSENHPDRSFMIDLAVSELTVRLLRHQARDFILSFTSSEPDNNGINAAVAYIKEHLKNNLDIDVLCKIACMSRTKFFTEFRNHLGCSPVAFQHQLRLKQAASLIRKGKQITQACYELGFASASHFSRCFKQHFGMSPSQYKSRKLVKPTQP